ncbi:MAG: glycosyltransferase [Lachnospiraceae bacterium]|nr:glycosyltransferase [Lachnospiraceae bacterium]
MSTKISVVTVCFNSEGTIAQTMESVLSQSLPPFEYIIIDGASTDGTMTVVNSYREDFEAKGIRFITVSERDEGIYDAMNKGCALATGEVTGILNSDDWYEEGCLAAVDEAFRRTDFDVFYADLRMVEIKPDGSEAPLFIKKARNRSYMTSRDWNHPTTFIRTELYRTYRYRTETLHDDYDLILRLKKAGARFEVKNQVLANFRMNGVSHKRNFRRALESCRTKYRIYRENGYSPLYFFECFGVELAKLLIG